MLRFAGIVGMCILAAIAYGVVHDQITARVCVEYFTIGHPRVFATDDPTLLGLGWGVIATWWVGLMLGLPLALAARVGGWPKLGPGQLLKPLAVLLVSLGALALVAGLAGWIAAQQGWVWLVGPLAERVPQAKHVAFLADLWAHLASYLGGFLGGVVLCVWTLLRRRALDRSETK